MPTQLSQLQATVVTFHYRYRARRANITALDSRRSWIQRPAGWDKGSPMETAERHAGDAEAGIEAKRWLDSSLSFAPVTHLFLLE